MKNILSSMNKTTKKNLITYAIVIITYVIVQIMLAAGSVSSLLQGLLVPLCVYVIAAVSLNLVVGISGELSLGHAGFMCVGAYASAFFSNCIGDGMPEMLRFVLAILVGAVVAGIFGILIGIPVLRLRGDYLAIVTLAFGEIIKNLMNVLYVGMDSKSSCFRYRCGQFEYGSRWNGDHQRRVGNYRNTEEFYIYHRRYIDSAYFVHCIKPDSFQKRTCNYVDPG